MTRLFDPVLCRVAGAGELDTDGSEPEPGRPEDGAADGGDAAADGHEAERGRHRREDEGGRGPEEGGGCLRPDVGLPVMSASMTGATSLQVGLASATSDTILNLRQSILI